MGGPIALVDCNNFYVSCKPRQPEAESQPAKEYHSDAT
jgi:hypothetical protein